MKNEANQVLKGRVRTVRTAYTIDRTNYFTSHVIHVVLTFAKIAASADVEATVSKTNPIAMEVKKLTMMMNNCSFCPSRRKRFADHERCESPGSRKGSQCHPSLINIALGSVRN